jgi:GNAT superfamily N-acetyltransferase
MSPDSDADPAVEIRRATHDDYEAVADFTSDIWPERGGDYIPRVYHDWLEDEPGQGKKTFLAEIDGEAVGIVQAVALTDDEAWFQSMRVAADYRRRGVSRRLNEATFEWARERGATVGRVMVFSWNAASLGAARAGPAACARPRPSDSGNGRPGLLEALVLVEVAHRLLQGVAPEGIAEFGRDHHLQDRRAPRALVVACLAQGGTDVLDALDPDAFGAHGAGD